MRTEDEVTVENEVVLDEVEGVVVDEDPVEEEDVVELVVWLDVLDVVPPLPGLGSA